jgi:hypothetical protein
MKRPLLFRRNKSAFSIIEMMMVTAIIGITGAAMLECLITGMTLFAKNTAMNTTHEESRRGMNRLVRDIHLAVSVPQLIDSSFNSIDSQPMASGVPTGTAGVSFQIVAHGPDYVFNDPAGNNMIMIRDDANGGGYSPHPGQRLIAPMWELEDDIYKVAAAGSANHHNVWCTNGTDVVISKTKNPATYAITYYTSRIAYMVKNGRTVTINGVTQYLDGELHRFEQYFYNGNSNPVWVDMGTVARSVTSATPFTVPLNPSGTPDNRYVGVSLKTGNSGYSNRNYRDINTVLNTQIPYRSKLTIYQ